MRENLPCIFPFLRRMIWNTAWLRDEWALADVCPDVLEVRRRTSLNKGGGGSTNYLHMPHTEQLSGLSLSVGRQQNYEWANKLKSWESTTAVIPAAIANFDEFQDIFCALDLLFLKPHHLNLLFPILQHPQLSFTIQKVKHLTTHIHAQHWSLFTLMRGKTKQEKRVNTHHSPSRCRFQRRSHTPVDLTSCSWVSSTWEIHPELIKRREI